VQEWCHSQDDAATKGRGKGPGPWGMPSMELDTSTEADSLGKICIFSLIICVIGTLGDLFPFPCVCGCFRGLGGALRLIVGSGPDDRCASQPKNKGKSALCFFTIFCLS